MKHKLIASVLALTLIFGGSTFSLASIKSSEVEDKIELNTDITTDVKVEPMIWLSVGKAIM